MKVITKITFDGYDDQHSTHVIKSPPTLEIMNKSVIELMCYELDGDLVWDDSKREFYDWLEHAQINTNFFSLERGAVEIDCSFIPMSEFLKFKSLWNDTFGDCIKWDFSICF